MENNKEVLKQISWVDNFIYTKNKKGAFAINAQIIYQELETLKFEKKKCNLALMLNRVIGTVYNQDDKAIEFNSDSNSDKKIFEVSLQDLNTKSKPLHHHENLNLNKKNLDLFKNEIIKKYLSGDYPEIKFCIENDNYSNWKIWEKENYEEIKPINDSLKLN